MNRRSRILVVGPAPLGKTIAAALRPQFEVTASPRVSIELFLQRVRPDLAVVESGTGDTLAEIDALLRFSEGLPIVLVATRPVPRRIASAVRVVLPPDKVRSHIADLTALLLDRRAMSVPARSDSVTLGIVSGNIEAGQHVAALCNDESDIADLARFWTVADEADEFLLVGSKSANQTIRRALNAAGMDCVSLIRSRRLTIITADRLNLALLQRVLRHIQASMARRAGIVRIIGAAAGWAENRARADGHFFCEHLWTAILADLPVVMMCPYRTASLSARRFVTDLLEMHPWVISHDELLRNPFVRS
jgi:hypothetical protein